MSPMGVSMSRLLHWFSAQQGHPKHVGWKHPAATLILVYSCVFVFMIAAADSWVEPTPVKTRAHGCGTFFGIYVCLSIVLRCLTYGSRALYEFVWACNIAMVLASYSLLTGRNLVAHAAMVAVSPDQLLWYIDIVGLLTTGTFPVGVAKYIMWKDTSWTRIITTTHHLWFLPLCIYGLDGSRHTTSVRLGIFMWAICVALSRWLIPLSLTYHHQGKLHQRKNYFPGQNGSPSSTFYLNINCSHEMWKDVPMFGRLRTQSALIHIFRTCLVGSIAICIGHAAIECVLLLPKFLS